MLRVSMYFPLFLLYFFFFIISSFALSVAKEEPGLPFDNRQHSPHETMVTVVKGHAKTSVGDQLLSVQSERGLNVVLRMFMHLFRSDFQPTQCIFVSNLKI